MHPAHWAIYARLIRHTLTEHAARREHLTGRVCAPPTKRNLQATNAMSRAALARSAGIHPETLRKRLRKGLPLAEAVSLPVRKFIATGTTLEQVLLDRITYEPNTGCWPWTGKVRHDGYGVFWFEGESFAAHRAAYTLFNDCAIPDGMHVLHSCDQPLCCCPSHLRVGTHADNMKDKAERGRTPKEQPKLRGERHYACKLTDEAAEHIRRREMTHAKYAALYGVSVATVNRAMRGVSKFGSLEMREAD